MQSKTQRVSNFSQAVTTTANSFRPDDEWQLNEIFALNKNSHLLARGHGLSYSDCCLNDQGSIVDTSRLNHILSFDATTGVAVCQAAVTFADLFLLHPQFIPPVLPGTLYATIAGGIANDVHGKNNPHAGNLGHHIEWLELQVGDQSIRCSDSEKPELFKATIAGLGLTGIIKRIAIRLQKASHWVDKKTEKFTCLPSLLAYMQNEGMQYEYQAAWLDLLNEPHALLTLANHVKSGDGFGPKLQKPNYQVPKLPLRCITPWLMKQFNRAYYQFSTTTTTQMPLWQFNNPLDAIKGWNHLYGKKGLLQFQAVFDADHAKITMDTLLSCIRSHKATPTLAVLKYFGQGGKGLLSFTQPGFTLAIDFIHNQYAKEAIAAMNQHIATLEGKVYLAKDLFLTRQQFITMYPRHEEFCSLLAKQGHLMNSDLGKRLGISSGSCAQ